LKNPSNKGFSINDNTMPNKAKPTPGALYLFSINCFTAIQLVTVK
jgi:hypothetical protein